MNFLSSFIHHILKEFFIAMNILTVECQSFCPKIVTVFMSAFKSTEQVLEGESDNGNQDQSSRIL